MDKTTEDLQSELTQAKSFNEFYDKNKTELGFPSVTAYLEHLMKIKNMKKAEVVAALNLERSYGYHILDGKKNPNRDRLIILAIAVHANIEETQNMLKYAKERPLYARDPRDGLIFFGIKNRKNLTDINYLLSENNLKILQ